MSGYTEEYLGSTFTYRRRQLLDDGGGHENLTLHDLHSLLPSEREAAERREGEGIVSSIVSGRGLSEPSARESDWRNRMVFL